MIIGRVNFYGTWYRISDATRSLWNRWDRAILDFSGVSISLSEPYGGHGAPKFGRCILSGPWLREKTGWPSPVNGELELSWLPDYESDQTLGASIYNGSIHRATPDFAEVEYDCHPPAIGETLDDIGDTAFSGGLGSVMTQILTACDGIDSVNTSGVRAPEPNISFDGDGDDLAVETAATIASFFCHGFYIVDRVAHVVDIKNGVGPGIEARYGTAFEPTDPKPLRKVITKIGSNKAKYNTPFSYGERKEITSPATNKVAIAETAVEDIAEVMGRTRGEFDLPLARYRPRIGDEAICVNQQQRIEGVVVGLSYNYTKSIVTAKVVGVVS